MGSAYFWDSLGDRLFSLLYETVHVWLGANDLYNDRRYSTEKVKPIEVICNAVVDMVKNEIDKGQDELQKWVKERQDDFQGCNYVHPEIIPKYAEVMQYTETVRKC